MVNYPAVQPAAACPPEGSAAQGSLCSGQGERDMAQISIGSGLGSSEDSQGARQAA